MVEAGEPKRLKKAERRQQILLELRLKPHVRVSELAAQFGVTTETVRRDMEELSEAGLLARAHGGVLRLGTSETLGGLRADIVIAR